MSACRLCVVDTEPSCVTDIIAERDQLRTDLAAAVAECKRLRKCMDGEIQERNELRARLAAIDGAPTVAVVLESNRDFFEPHRYLNHSYEKLPPIGTQLIARPAKGAP